MGTSTSKEPYCTQVLFVQASLKMCLKEEDLHSFLLIPRLKKRMIIRAQCPQIMPYVPKLVDP